jgi:hypothetical protein
MPLNFYIDDSGKSDPPVFVLGGLALSSDMIASFEAEWAWVLSSDPAIPYFKMKEAQSRRGPFKRMATADRDRKVLLLAEVLQRHAKTLISVVVQHDDYRRVFEGQMMPAMDRPYEIIFHLIIANAFKLCKAANINDPVEFIFDRQRDHEKSLQATYEVTRKGMMPELQKFFAADPRHADDKDEVALQAADMVAWHVRRSWRQGFAGLRTASSAGPIIANIEGSHEVITENMLRQIAKGAISTIRNMKTLFPYEAAFISEEFDKMATFANFQLMDAARPLQPVELISFPAIGTARFQLVHKCAELGMPHLHRRSDSSCLGAVSAA